MRGETLAVDGVVQVGEAEVLPYPGAATAVRRGPGDALLAGARVLNGAIRVLATRVGDERSLLRVHRLGSAADRDPSSLERVSTLASSYGGLFVLALAGAVVLLADVEGPARGARDRERGPALGAAPVAAAGGRVAAARRGRDGRRARHRLPERERTRHGRPRHGGRPLRHTAC